MEVFIIEWYTTTQIETLNTVWKYLQVVMLSDVTNHFRMASTAAIYDSEIQTTSLTLTDLEQEKLTLPV